MDEIADQFQYTLCREQYRPTSSRKSLHNHRCKYDNQEQRRVEILRLQQSNRHNILDSYRGIYNLVESDESRGLFNEPAQAIYRPRYNVPGFTRNNYKNILMLSEWLVEKPVDFTSNWLMAPCPKGIRVLVVASGGMTRLYTKYGQLFDTILSRLPGGRGNVKRKDSSILDGFYCREEHLIYVVDVLFWRNHILADGEMEFRRFWLEGKFSDHPEYGRTNRKYRVSFKLLPMITCDILSLQDFMLTYPPLPEARLDGLLFYHKGANYISGQTPLVGWLYPYMVSEVLYPGMVMHPSFAAKKPENYVNQAHFIEKFDERYRNRNSLAARRHRRNRNKYMDLETAKRITYEQAQQIRAVLAAQARNVGGYPDQQAGGFPDREAGGNPQEVGGNSEQEAEGNPDQEAGGNPNQEAGANPHEEAGGNPDQEVGGNPDQKAGGNPDQGVEGYPEQGAGGYPSQGAAGYPDQAAGGYPEQGPGGYRSQGAAGYFDQGARVYPIQGAVGYPSQGAGGYPDQGAVGYPGHGAGGYPEQGAGGYPSQGAAGYPDQAAGGYPEQGAGGYRSQGAAGYPDQAAGGYPDQVVGGYPDQGALGYPGQGVGVYPSQGVGGYPDQAAGTYQGQNGSWLFTFPEPEAYSEANGQYPAVEPCCEYCCNFGLTAAYNNQYQPYQPLNLYDTGNQGDNEAIEENVRDFFAHFEHK